VVSPAAASHHPDDGACSSPALKMMLNGGLHEACLVVDRIYRRRMGDDGLAGFVSVTSWSDTARSQRGALLFILQCR